MESEEWHLYTDHLYSRSVPGGLTMKDPVVLEIRRIRREMDEQAHHDFDRYIMMLKERRRKSGKGISGEGT